MTRLRSARDAAAKPGVTTATRPAADERVSVMAGTDCEINRLQTLQRKKRATHRILK